MHIILDFIAGVCLMGAVAIIMQDRPMWQRVAVFVLLFFGIAAIATMTVLAAGKAG